MFAANEEYSQTSIRTHLKEAMFIYCPSEPWQEYIEGKIKELSDTVGIATANAYLVNVMADGLNHGDWPWTSRIDLVRITLIESPSALNDTELKENK